MCQSKGHILYIGNCNVHTIRHCLRENLIWTSLGTRFEYLTLKMEIKEIYDVDEYLTLKIEIKEIYDMDENW